MAAVDMLGFWMRLIISIRRRASFGQKNIVCFASMQYLNIRAQQNRRAP